MAAFVYAGWFFHRSEDAFIFIYSKKYCIFLLLATVLFWFPLIIRWLIRRIGAKRFMFCLVPVLVLCVTFYSFFSLRYYYSQEHLFDPYLQMNPATFPEEDLQKGENEFRILCLGGSTTESGDLREAERYPGVLQSLLEQRFSPSMTLKVFNAGRAWYTTKHSLINYVTYYADWQPDLVIVMHGINDLYRSFSPPFFAVGPYNEFWSHFYGPSIEGAKPPTYEQVWIRKLSRQSFFGMPLRLPFETWFSLLRFQEVDYPLDRYHSLIPFERYLRKIVRLVQEEETHVLLMTQPFLYREALQPDEARVLRFGWQACSTKTKLLGLEYPTPQSLERAMTAFNAATRKVAQDEGCFFADADAWVKKDLNHFWDDVHYTAEGARDVARAALAAILESGVINKRLTA